MIEWTDADGQRAVLHDDGRLSVFGSPSMTSGDGKLVAIGIDAPADPIWREALRDIARGRLGRD